ncbi:Uncharacterized protein BP5553_00998 [Venustampulla echinocandica]|uniref:C2 NT-type domain-containing protein n=1 Tax=Venustampulla echinocandica TaxID=2656787 RepID=A0A370TZR1_9HELO|nr:Uncharacterized protein BP5553_00998 [Venustampulla echinocandica]RDL41019.1 Uncharacterized protein BP5553_00998 [Venustampulla echinocandica]
MISKLLVSKARKIIDLNNVPLVAGTAYVKWHLPSSTEQRGCTQKSPIAEHKVFWNYVKDISVRLTIDKNNNLAETLIHFEVVQEFNNIATKGERITLGTLSLNLAEYVEESEMGVDGEEGVVRRYLMQESKINSTLKVSIFMRQVDGEKNFVAPPLKTAPVFGGIAGIVAGETGEQDDLRRCSSVASFPDLRSWIMHTNIGYFHNTDMPVISKSRDHGELQDMYRRTLAASWSTQGNELRADQCIEDIFNGGDGWKDTYSPNTTDLSSSTPRIAQQEDSGDDNQHHHQQQHARRHQRSQSGASARSQNTITKKPSMPRIRGHKHSSSHETLDRQGDTQSAQIDHSLETGSDRGTTGSSRKAKEVTEFDVRDDLVAWRSPALR